MNAVFEEKVQKIEGNLTKVIRGKSESIRLLVIALLTGGHALLEDVPGTGKTTLAKSLARTMDGVFHRIQFTPDLLPADITGSSYFNPKEGVFVFREGPIFANIVLADEINRTSPRTQSALLEVMGENQVTIEGNPIMLAPPFFVIATQNPIEFHGTYPLPEAQLDRFQVRITMGYPSKDDEIDILYSQNDYHPFENLTPVVTCQDVIELQKEIKTVRFDRTVAEYIINLVQALRQDTRLRLSISPRGSLALYRTAQACACLAGRDYVLPEDVRTMAAPVLTHRMMLDTKSRYGGILASHILEEALEKTAVPR